MKAVSSVWGNGYHTGFGDGFDSGRKSGHADIIKLAIIAGGAYVAYKNKKSIKEFFIGIAREAGKRKLVQGR